MTATIEELRARLGEIEDVRAATGLLEWDQLVMMPPGGSRLRARQLGTLIRIAHDMLVDEHLGALLEELRPLEQSLDPLSDDASLIRVTRRDREKAVRVPAALHEEMATHSSAAVQAWAQARADDDFAAFRPWLERTLELKRRYVDCFAPEGDPYDPLLDDFEPGMPTTEVRRVFDVLRPALRAIAHAAEPGDDPPFASAHYPRAAQEELSLELARTFGFEQGVYRLDPTVHPFCLSLGVDDIRLTTRYAEDDLYATSLFSTMHEVGHGLYEHGIDKALERTPLGSGCSAALHESQSRLWENLVGRSRPFWEWFFPRVRAAFPAALAAVELDEFLAVVNRARPSFIRVDADEATYGLHLILRFELEQELLFGDLAVADLPEAWNARFEELFGLSVPNDRLGCLQDVHWAGGSFGYFPTYLLGTVVSVQIWERLRRDLPDLDEQLRRGELGEIGGWLREHLYRLGRKLTPTETIERVCGGPIDPEPYLAYLRDKTATPAAD
jgi:carboxypeptidase Taq